VTSTQKLREELVAIEAETAKSLKAANEKILALDAQIKKSRAEELLQAGVEIRETLKKYNITIQDALSIEAPTPTKQATPSSKGNSYLAEIRDYYNNNP
jgi:fructose-specific phosphotransferase system component IIB